MEYGYFIWMQCKSAHTFLYFKYSHRILTRCAQIYVKNFEKMSVCYSKTKNFMAHFRFPYSNSPILFVDRSTDQLESNSVYFIQAHEFFLLSYTVTWNFIFCFRWLSMAQTRKNSQLRFGFHNFGIRQSKKKRERHRI